MSGDVETYFVRTLVRTPPAKRDEMSLATLHPHPRDELVVFDEGEHAYYVIHAKSNTFLRAPVSVSGLYHRFFGEFDANGMSLSVAKKRKGDKTSPYYWLLQTVESGTDEDGARAIRDAWNRSGMRAASFGTQTHLDLELHLNRGGERSLSAHSAQTRAGMDWIENKALREYGWKPYRTEWSIFIDMRAAASSDDTEADGDLVECHAHLLCGQLDALFVHPETLEYHLCDWKICQSDKLERTSGTFGGRLPTGKKPLHEVPDNSYGHYLVQQSLYAYILKKRYGIRVSTARLVHIPSDEATPVAREIMLTLLDDSTIQAMFSPPPP